MSKVRVPMPVLLSYLDGELRPDEAAAIERVSVDSESVRRELDSLRTIRRALAAPVADLERREVTLPRRPSVAPRVSASSPRRLAARAWLGLGAAALVLAGVGLGQLLPRPEELPSFRERDVRAKSGALPIDAARWAGIRAFRLGARGAEPERLRGHLRQEDGLLFAYTNLGDEPYGHLMVFCVDVEREVHWFYPAYVDARDNPVSVPIQVGQELALSEVVYVSLPKGPLTLYAAFTREPLDVQSVEGWLQAHPEGGSGFAGTDAVVSQSSVTVD
jgi:hypothetical protein